MAWCGCGLGLAKPAGCWLWLWALVGEGAKTPGMLVATKPGGTALAGGGGGREGAEALAEREPLPAAGSPFLNMENMVMEGGLRGAQAEWGDCNTVTKWQNNASERATSCYRSSGQARQCSTHTSATEAQIDQEWSREAWVCGRRPHCWSRVSAGMTAGGVDASAAAGCSMLVSVQQRPYSLTQLVQQ